MTAHEWNPVTPMKQLCHVALIAVQCTAQPAPNPKRLTVPVILANRPSHANHMWDDQAAPQFTSRDASSSQLHSLQPCSCIRAPC